MARQRISPHEISAKVVDTPITLGQYNLLKPLAEARKAKTAELLREALLRLLEEHPTKKTPAA
jgi:hypothetical protein